MIEAVSEQTIEEVLPMIRAYQQFYKVPQISDSRNREFFAAFGESNPAGCQFLFRENRAALGFATVYFTYTSTIAAKVAVLNDLYTLPGQRGKGIGRQLIEHCRRFAAERGAARLQWITAPDNRRAQALYDSLPADKSTWHQYNYGA